MLKQNKARINVTKRYLDLRERALKYSNDDMNLKLENSKQVYLAVFDMPVESNIVGFHTQTLVMLFGLNTQIYYENGDVIIGLEENKNVMNAMQSFFVSCPQVLKTMQLTSDIDFFECNSIRVYLKTSKGIYFKELNMKNREDRFLNMLLENVLAEIAKVK